ncbi:MAG: hypothetical protein J6P61_02430 [Erysipelotrichaceae bacterium]|nr:hypothetical protein [Erysipelotrichaceae bacterium]
MKVTKKVIAHLNKCYSIASLHYHDQDFVLVAAEKQDPCYMFDLKGHQVDTIWEGPGGVMTMQQVPGSDGIFLATHKFYSPNDSAEAKIVVVTPVEGEWIVRTLVDLPFVHRFDVLTRNGVNYLIACALKSGHDYKNDWSHPGAVYAAVLPDDLSQFNDDHQLELTLIKDNMLKNHGYYRNVKEGIESAVISCDNGVFRFIPPEAIDGQWTIETLLETPGSDAVLVDLDGDGLEELAVLSPFHGERISIYHLNEGKYERVYDFEEDAPFTHAIYGGDLCGTKAVVIGHRQGKRNLMAFTYNKDLQQYEMQILDEDCGSANVMHYVDEGKDIIIGANREIDEIAMYIIE